MSTTQLLAEIDRGINALQKARALCLKGGPVAPKTANVTKAAAKKAAKAGMTAEGRARIAAAQQKRWAKVKREKTKLPRRLNLL